MSDGVDSVRHSDERGPVSDLRHDPRSSPELIATIQNQWDAIAALMQANESDESDEADQIWEQSPLSWGVEGPLQDYPVIWLAVSQPRNNGMPMFGLALLMAMEYRSMEALMLWMAAPTDAGSDE